MQARCKMPKSRLQQDPKCHNLSSANAASNAGRWALEELQRKLKSRFSGADQTKSWTAKAQQNTGTIVCDTEI